MAQSESKEEWKTFNKQPLALLSIYYRLVCLDPYSCRQQEYL